jgi:putative ABC transport system permease protein
MHPGDNASMSADLRYAVRQLAKSPGFAAAAIAVLALGIGANTAVFSIVHALLFAPPSYARPAEVVQVFSRDKRNAEAFRAFSYPTYRDIRDHNTVFSGVLAHHVTMVAAGESGESRRVLAQIVSSNFFAVLGVAPAQGRAFLPEEETPGGGAQVAIVSHNFWKKHGFDPALLGSVVRIKTRPFTVVGIMPAGFTGTTQLFSPEIWLPLGSFGVVVESPLADRRRAPLLVVGRLRPGVTSAAAGPALAVLAASLERQFPVEQKDQTFIAAPLARLSTGDAPREAGGIAGFSALLMGMAALVLLVACLNLANMLLARSTARRKEIAIRLALGGGRARIVRQLITEGLVLAVAGGAFGLLLALWSSDLLVSFLAQRLPEDLVWSSGPSPTLLAATFGFCLLATVCFALGPALKLSRGDVLTDLKRNAGEDPPGRRFQLLPRHSLVVLQIAVSLALLTAGALFVRSAGKAAQVDTGLQVERNFLLEVEASSGGDDRRREPALYQQLAERLSALPGVESASVSAVVPFGLVVNGRTVQRAGAASAPDATGATAAEGRAFAALLNGVGADYFRTVGLPLLRGREFRATEASEREAPAVAIIDDTLAGQLWPGGDALGQRIQYAGAGSKADATIEIVGIVPTTRFRLFERWSRGALYVPLARASERSAFLHVRLASRPRGGEAALGGLLRRTLLAVEPGLVILSARTFREHLEADPSLAMVRAGAATFSAFGAVALGLAVVGLYGVKAYAVARRTREIGIRMALGARADTVLWMVLRDGAVMLSLGLLLGLGLAVATGRLLGRLLYGVSALDPVAFTTAPLLLAATALLACWLPARRATRIDPMVALRVE